MESGHFIFGHLVICISGSIPEELQHVQRHLRLHTNGTFKFLKTQNPIIIFIEFGKELLELMKVLRQSDTDNTS